MSFWQLVAAPIVLTTLIVLLVYTLGRRWPQAAPYLTLVLPPAILILLMAFFSQPDVAGVLKVTEQASASIVASSIGAVIGVVGAGAISIMEAIQANRRATDQYNKSEDVRVQQNTIAENARKTDLDWRLLVLFKGELRPYNLAEPGDDRTKIARIVADWYDLAEKAQRAGVLPADSTFHQTASDLNGRNFGSAPRRSP